MIIRAATRGSALALWQTTRIATLVEQANPGVVVEPVVVSTTGDRDKTTPLHEIGGKGVFVKEVQAAVLDGRADIAVHSAKDLPAVTPDSLVLAAVPERADVRDALVGSTLDSLADGATLGTGSIRRRVQLTALRPDIAWVELRGNIDTRLARLDGPDVLDAIVMAAAALDRLGRTPATVDRLDPELVVPQVGQGALAVECATDNTSVRDLLSTIDDAVDHRALRAERAFLAELGGDCFLPAGAVATIGSAEDGSTEYGTESLVTMRAMLASERDGAPQVLIRSAHDGEALGVALAVELRALVG